jgi:hypothetical protein
VSINFVHDKRTWDQVRAIEQALGKSIVRVSTDDMDVMEEVIYFLTFVLASCINYGATDIQESTKSHFHRCTLTTF